ncbi:MAG: protoporphyrinogen oxidase, partial [Anaerolineae bacterium]
MKKVIVIGGGIAGLSTAYYLQKQAAEAGIPIDCTLIESAPRFGGKIATMRRDGFVIEGGPDSFLTQKPWALQLARELGLYDRLLGTNDDRRKVYVLSNGRLVELPDGVMLVVPTKIMPFVTSPLISWPGKLRMGLDLVIPPRRLNGDESLASFIRRRLGQEALDKIAEPLMAGIHVADPERLSLQATFPRFIDLEQKHGSLIRGMLRRKGERGKGKGEKGEGEKEKREKGKRRRGEKGKREKEAGHNRSSNLQSPMLRRGSAQVSNPQSPISMFMSLRGGLTELVDALVSHLDHRATLLAGRRVERIVSQPDAESAYEMRLDDGGALEADAVVLATPAYVSANLVEALNPDLAAGLRQIRYVSTATVSLGFRESDLRRPLDGFGFVIPHSEKRRIAACTWTSTKFDHRAPGDHVLIRSFVGGAYDEHLVDLDDDAMTRMVRDELADIMGITAEPTTVEIFRWRKGNPQYDVGHLERVAALEATCDPGLFLAGSAYRGVGLPDCVKNGRETAEQLVEYLG